MERSSFDKKHNKPDAGCSDCYRLNNRIRRALGEVEVVNFWRDKDPCWKIMDCPEYVYRQCGAYLHPERPCWEVVYTQGEILTSIPKDCKNCKVYRLYRKFPDPSILKV